MKRTKKREQSERDSYIEKDDTQKNLKQMARGYLWSEKRNENTVNIRAEALKCIKNAPTIRIAFLMHGERSKLRHENKGIGMNYYYYCYC